MNKIKLITLISIFCLMISIPTAFAHDNETVTAAENVIQDTLSTDYYFDSNAIDDSGDGSQKHPYRDLTTSRIKENSTIHLASGEYTLSGSKDVSNVVIIGENPSSTVITYRGNGLSVSTSLTLKDVTLSRFSIDNNGNISAENTVFRSSTNTVIKSSHGMRYVDIKNCTFTDEGTKTSTITRYSSGGVIHMEDGHLTIEDSVFDNVYSAGCGGAIYMDEGFLSITNTIFNNTYAADYGGAIVCENNVNATIKKSKFINSRSIGDAGGAIYLLNSTLHANDLQIIGCSATFGGAITSLYSELVLDKFTAEDNCAKYDGGAVYAMYRYLTLTNSVLNNNEAKNGGALFIDSLILYTDSNKFTNNMAYNTGGAVYRIFPNDYLPVTNSQFNNSFSGNLAFIENDDYESDEINLTIGNGECIYLKYDPLYNGTLPEKFDLREIGAVTPVRQQGSGGNCWSFTSLASLESAILKATGTSYDLSEENMKNLMAAYSDYGWFMPTNEGGFDRMGIGYLTSWMGPVNDSEDTYNPKSTLSPLLDGFVHVQNILLFTRHNATDNDAIKRALMDYGAVGTCIHWDSSYADGKNYYFYQKGYGLNHAVTIVGWDDTYSRDNFNKFKVKPAGDGAWIIKNSWGTNMGDEGFYYVSYYDTEFAKVGKSEASFAIVFNNTINYEKNYQYDIQGKTEYLVLDDKSLSYKNRFIATDDEYLAAVSTYFRNETNWNLSVYVNDVLELTKSGFALPSYSTIELGKFIQLHKGDVFEVVFKITVDFNEVGFPVSEAVSLNHEFYRENISFVSFDDTHWFDLYHFDMGNNVISSQVACIKAFTIVNPIPTKIEFPLVNVRDNHANIVVKVSDKYGNLMDGNLTFDISGTTQIVPLVDGIAKFEGIGLSSGINRFTAGFSKFAYNSSSNFVLISLNPVETSVSLNFSSKVSPMYISAFVKDSSGNPVESGVVTFNVEGKEFNATVKNGVAQITHSFDGFGIKDVSASYHDLYCYKSSFTQKTITLTNFDTHISLNISGNRNPVLITAHVLDEDNEAALIGNVTFTIEDVNYVVPVKNGVASKEYVFKTPGLKKISVSFFDDTYQYTASNISDSIDVVIKSTALSLTYNSTVNPVLITAMVIDSDGELVDRGVLYFDFNGTENTWDASSGGINLIKVFKTMGLNSVKVSYVDSSYYYAPSNNSTSIEMTKLPVELYFTHEVTADAIHFIFTTSKPITEKINLNINGYELNYYVVNGEFVLKNDFSVGGYSVRASIESDYYESNNISQEVQVEGIASMMDCSDAAIYTGNMKYSLKLYDAFSKPISNGLVILNAGIREIRAASDTSGSVSFNLDGLPLGDYYAVITFTGDETHKECSENVKITVKSTIDMPSNTVYTYNSKYVATLYDKYGNLLKNTAVVLRINGVDHRIYTDPNGILSYNVIQYPGSYGISVINMATGEVANGNMIVNPRITGNSDVSMYFGAGNSYTVRVFDDHGNPQAGAAVTFIFRGLYNVEYSDGNGYASFTINANPGTYTITASFNGYSVSNYVSVSKTLITKNVAVKKGKTLKFTAKLLGSNGKVLKNKKITFKLKGKTYKVKTKKNGIATLKVSTKKFKAGKYSIVTIYGKARMTNKITVRR